MNISERISQLFQSAKSSSEELSVRLQISEERLHKLLDGASPTLQEALRISKVFHVSMEWLTEMEREGRQPVGFRIMDPEVEAGFIENHANPEVVSKMETYFLPGFSDRDNLLFKVHGKSMVPTVAENDYLVCRRLNEPFRLPDGSLAVVLVRGQLVVKRVRRTKHDWILNSERPEVQDEQVSLNEIKAAWEVVGKVTRDFVENSKKDFLKKAGLQRELKILRQDLEECHRAFAGVQQSLQARLS